MKPYESIFRGCTINNTIDETEEAIVGAVLQTGTVTFWNFKTQEEADNFVVKFPKYVKVKSQKCWGGSVNEERKRIIYDVTFSISKLNQVTGAINETGLKRLEGLIRTLKQEGFIM